MIRGPPIIASLSGILLLAIAAVFPNLAPKPNPTAQVPDLLILEEDTLSIFANPLEAFFDEDHPRPKEIFPGGCLSTACWRGYQAIWRIIEDDLFLIAIEDCCEGIRLASTKIGSLLDGRYQGGKAWANWFTGELRIPQGEILRYVHMGYNSIYEREVILEIEAGHLISRDTVSNVPTHDPIFPGGIEAFQQYIVEHVDWGSIAEPERKALLLLGVDTLGDAFVDTVYSAPSEEIIRELHRVIESAPRWEPGYERGKKTEFRWGLPIKYKNDQHGQ